MFYYYTTKSFCIVINTRTSKYNGMQEVASQKEFVSHYVFSRTLCPSNSLPSSASYSGRADWVQPSVSVMGGNCLHLTQHCTLSVINKSTAYVFLSNCLCAFARTVEGLTDCGRSPDGCNWLLREGGETDKVISQRLWQQKAVVLRRRGAPLSHNTSAGRL